MTKSRFRRPTPVTHDSARTYFACAVLIALYAATMLLLHGCRSLPVRTEGGGSLVQSQAADRYAALVAAAGQAQKVPRPAPLPPATPRDTRPEMLCYIPSHGSCVWCHWWQARGDAGLPFRLRFVVNDAIAAQTDQAGEFGHPVFHFQGADGGWHYCRRVGDNERWLVTYFKRHHP